ncbi:MAG: AMIN domain-containing protein [Terriglobales bacterium]
MSRLSFVFVLLIAAAAYPAAALPPAATKPPATVESVKVTSTGSGASVEIATSQPVALRSQVITDPDRLILDFPNAQAAGDLRTKLLNQGEIKGYRVARFSENPPTTRVVIDLNSPQHYQIFPDGKTIIVKLRSDEQQAAAKAHLDNVAYTPAPPKPVQKMQVEYVDGRLHISADHASLAEVLGEVQRQTGTDIPIPPGAAQEQIIANIGPLPIREALVSLLNGSHFNFILVDSETEPGKLKSVILTYRGAGGISQPTVAAPEQPVVQIQPEPEPPQPMPEAQPEPQPQEGQQEAPQPQQENPNPPNQ